MGYCLVLTNSSNWRNFGDDTLYIDCESTKPTPAIVVMVLAKYRKYKYAHLIKGSFEYRYGKRGFHYDESGHISSFGPVMTNIPDSSIS